MDYTGWKNERILIGLLWILKVTEGKDVQVNCIFSERCILPCSIEPNGGDEVIHWYNTNNKDNPVHSYYEKNNQLRYQDPKYKGRTSLFLDQIAPGNASLLLTDVKIQDEGRYKCYTSTTKGNDEKFVNLLIQALVKLVDITEDTGTLTCRSKGIYPKPILKWSTVPETAVQALEPQKQQDVQGLFSITSTVDMTSNSTYICKVTAGANSQTTSWRKQKLYANPDRNLIPCSISEENTNLKDFSLTWTFNMDSPVLTFDTRTSHSKVYGRWQGHVKYENGQTEIELNNLNDDTFGGTYRCEVSTAEFRHLEDTVVSIPQQHPAHSSAGINTPALIVGVVVLLILIASIATAFICWRKKRNRKRVSASDSKAPQQESEPLKTDLENKNNHAVQETTACKVEDH